MWAACETPFPAPQIEPNTVQLDDLGEMSAALTAHEHVSNVSSIAGSRQYHRDLRGQTRFDAAPVGGFEPPTKGLTVLCTTVVLHRNALVSVRFYGFVGSADELPA